MRSRSCPGWLGVFVLGALVHRDSTHRSFLSASVASHHLSSRRSRAFTTPSPTSPSRLDSTLSCLHSSRDSVRQYIVTDDCARHTWTEPSNLHATTFALRAPFIANTRYITTRTSSQTSRPTGNTFNMVSHRNLPERKNPLLEPTESTASTYTLRIASLWSVI